MRVDKEGAGRLVRTRVLPLMLSHAEENGVAIEDLLQTFELDPEVVGGSDFDAPLGVVWGLAEQLAKRLEEPSLGVTLAARSAPGKYGFVELIARSAENFRAACRFAVRYGPLLRDGSVFSFSESANSAAFIQRIPAVEIMYGQHINETIICYVVRLVREATRMLDWVPEGVQFAHPEDSNADTLQEYLGTSNLSFGHGFCGVILDETILNAPIVSHDPKVLTSLTESAEGLRESALQGVGFWTRLRNAMVDAVLAQEPQVGWVAKKLAISSRSLQRKLSAEGTTFRNLIAETQRDLATVYLLDESQPIGEIALRVGYFDARSFARAFKQQTGQAPSEFRETHLRAGSSS